MKKSESIVELAKALNKFQKELRPAKKTSENPFFKSSYADLVAVWNAVREPLAKHGLSIAQPMGCSEMGTPTIETILCHDSGEWISGELPIKPTKDDPQSLGSAITYGRRYSLAAMLGLVTEEEDDDGEKAMGRDTKTTQQEPKQTTSGGEKKDFDKSKLSRKKGTRSENQKNTISNMAKAAFGKDSWVEKLHDLVADLLQEGMMEHEASADWSTYDASELIESLGEALKEKKQNQPPEQVEM